jgi:Zn-finger nucleic acid-binding protein
MTGGPYRIEGSEEGGTCPRCTDTTLRVLALGSSRVLACRACGGVFAEHAVLDALIAGDGYALRALADEATQAPPRPLTVPKVLACPKCRQDMASTHVRGASCAVDICPDHGVWFDRWEAQLVVEAVRDPLVARTLRRELR